METKDTVTLTLHVPKDLHDKFEAQCESVGKTMEHVLLAYMSALANEDVFPGRRK